VRKLADATEGEIAEVPGIGPRLASAVLAALSPSRANGDNTRGGT